MQKILEKLRWYYWTRFLGSTIIIVALVQNSSNANQGTLVLVGAGMVGFDFVVHKADRPKDKQDD